MRYRYGWRDGGVWRSVKDSDGTKREYLVHFLVTSGHVDIAWTANVKTRRPSLWSNKFAQAIVKFLVEIEKTHEAV
jgi:hypothetical protein